MIQTEPSPTEQRSEGVEFSWETRETEAKAEEEEEK